MSWTSNDGAGRLPFLQGLLPVRRSQVLAEILAGATLSALAIPEVMGYTRIAGTPVITGLYTLLLPLVLFAAFGSSRHLVVAADSATAAILASGLAGLAARNSPEWLATAGLLALMAAGLLLVARIARLGFLADFLSHTVLTGFLTGVGLQVALGELPDLLGILVEGHGTINHLMDASRRLDEARTPVMVAGGIAIFVVMAARRLSHHVPGALIAVIGSIVVSEAFDLPARGVPVIGPIPSGLPGFSLPHVAWSLGLVERLLPTALAMTVVILAQSAATSRAYAARNEEHFNENLDLVGLVAANLGAALSGTFVVNGSPTKTQMVVDAGGRSQLAQLVTSLVTILVLLVFTGPLSRLPQVVLSAIVFLIGIELIDLAEMRRILAVRPVEFSVAAITAAVVVLFGVEEGIIAAMVLSLLAHVRRGYRPKNSLLVGEDGHRISQPVASRGELQPGLLAYRFNHSMYYANAAQLLDEVTILARDARPALRWFCFDMAAVDGVDYTAAQTLRSLLIELQQQGVRPVFTDLGSDVRAQLERYGIVTVFGSNAIYNSVSRVVTAYNALDATGESSSHHG